MLYFKILIFLFCTIGVYGDELAIVISKDANIDTLSKKELSKIFLSKTRKLPNGEKTFLIEINDEKIQTKFYQIICNKNENQLRKYWTKMIFTGRGQPPKKLQSVDDVISYIKKNKNAISYIPLKYVDKSMQILMVI